ncbi:NfeD family protein [Auritidibacter ignavus]|uniref:NfeD family protein n=1 Tax=Auritidibacter ignavus TaxID=678932 RepID=UPI00109D4B74|nr:NfeD family protein [Auritidibacter ignavus]
MFDWLSDNTWLLWLVVAAGSVLVELMMLDLIFLMLAGGALGALIASLFGIPFAAEIGVFAAVAAVLLFALRPVAMRHLSLPGSHPHDDSIEAYPGRNAAVTSEVSEHAGFVKLDGEIWSARTTSPMPLAVDQEVVIERVDGAILWVRPQR